MAYLDRIAYIMGGYYCLKCIIKNPGETLLESRPSQAQEIKLGSLFKLDVERKASTNETSSIGHVNSGRMVSIRGIGKKGSE